MLSLGEKIKSLRIEKGIRQRQLARIAGITQSVLSRVENNKIHDLQSETLKRLATALGVTVDYLVGKSSKDMIPDDPQLKSIIQYYEKLPLKSREQIYKFARFLVSEENEQIYQGSQIVSTKHTQ